MAETPTYFDASFYMITDESHILKRITDGGIFNPSRDRRAAEENRRRWI
jgi:hypothetical protein